MTQERTTLAQRIEHRMLCTSYPITVVGLVREFDTTTKCVTNAMVVLRKKYGDKLVRSRVIGHTAYAITGKPVVKVKQVFPLPADLWRGWCNPLSGIKPARLGLGWQPFNPQGY